MGERRDALGASAANLASDSHQIAHHRDSGGIRPRPAPVVERIRAKLAFNPNRIVGAFDSGEDGGFRDERRAHREDEAALGLAGAADEPDRVAELMGVIEILRGDAADPFDEDVAGGDALAECEGREERQLGARVVAIHIGGRIGFGIA